MNPGDIWLVSYPFTDSRTRKRRPALILSSSAYNRASPNAVAAMVTSNTERVGPYDIVVASSDPRFRQTGLLRSSTIRCATIFTLNKKLYERLLGRLPQDTFCKVRAKLASLFGLRTQK